MLDPIFLNSTFVFVILPIHDSFFFQIVLLSSIFTLQLPPFFCLLPAYLFFSVQLRTGKWFSRHESRNTLKFTANLRFPSLFPSANNGAAATRFDPTRRGKRRHTPNATYIEYTYTTRSLFCSRSTSAFVHDAL